MDLNFFDLAADDPARYRRILLHFKRRFCKMLSIFFGQNIGGTADSIIRPLNWSQSQRLMEHPVWRDWINARAFLPLLLAMEADQSEVSEEVWAAVQAARAI